VPQKTTVEKEIGLPTSSPAQKGKLFAFLTRWKAVWPVRMRYHTRQKLSGFMFILPVLLFFAAFNVYPMFSALVVSFFEFDLFGPMKFIGFENYANLATNKNFWSAVRVTLSYTALFGPPSWVIGFALASLIKEKILGRDFFRSVFFMPTILSAVAMATAWSLLLRVNGPINGILGVYIPWLTNQKTALLGIVIVAVWQGMGWFMVVFLAGLQGIPEEYYEAAKIDGAGRWQLLWYITLPFLRPIFAFVVIQTIVGGMKVFTPMFIMTGGGPNNVTRSLAMMIYHEGLRDFRLGRASAISVVAFVFILILTIIQLRVFRVREEIGS
jgi:ABC-type sugar transport system permease subunit